MHPFSTSLPRACRMWYIPAEALVTSTAVRKPFRAVDAVTVSVPYGNLCCDVSFGVLAASVCFFTMNFHYVLVTKRSTPRPSDS